MIYVSALVSVGERSQLPSLVGPCCITGMLAVPWVHTVLALSSTQLQSRLTGLTIATVVIPL